MDKTLKKLIVCLLIALIASITLSACQAQGTRSQTTEEIQEANANRLEARIDKLPPKDEITLANKSEVQSIRSDLGTGYNFVKIDDDHLKKLAEAEVRIRELEESGPKTTTTQQSSSTTSSTPPPASSSPQSDTQSGIIHLVLLDVWFAICFIQLLFSYGTAYRKTKANGDNGVSLFGWLIAYGFAALIPGLGIYLWSRSKKPNS